MMLLQLVIAKGGKIFNELVRGDNTRQEFFDRIIKVISALGGDDKHVF